MKKAYESPEYEIEKFLIKNSVLTATSDPGFEGGGDTEIEVPDNF